MPPTLENMMASYIVTHIPLSPKATMQGNMHIHPNSNTSRVSTTPLPPIDFSEHLVSAELHCSVIWILAKHSLCSLLRLTLAVAAPTLVGSIQPKPFLL
jgi:hypothetical protein